MPKKTKRSLEDLSNNNSVNRYLEMFAREAPDIREELARTLPAYNTLLSLRAATFEEFALKPVAIAQGLNVNYPLFSYKGIVPSCPRCESTSKVYRVKKNTYFCKNCNKKFVPNRNSISSGTECSSLTWMKVLYCMLEFYGIEKSCRYCNISSGTYYKIRDRLFYAMQLMMEEVKLYGVVQCDNTFYHVSFKGYDLSETDYPDDSPIEIIDYVPRAARKRGGSYSNKDKIINSSCVFAAIDSAGHVVVRYVGIGNATSTKLLNAVPESKYLASVPDRDPFDLMRNKSPSDEEVGSGILLVMDKEAALKKYAERLNFTYESHVYMKNHAPVAWPPGAHNIQRVNALHKRLRDFLRKANYVSTKYLPGFLVFFEFVENTGATPEAIGRLFEILVTPGLGQPPEFYKNLYTVPNYLIEWDKEDTALKKIPYNKLLTAYMYHQKQLDVAQFGRSKITVEQIMEATGIGSKGTVRRIYKNIVTAGLIDKVYEKFSTAKKIKLLSETAIKKEKPHREKKENEKKGRMKPVPDIYLEMYDAVCEMISEPLENREPILDVMARINEKHGTNYAPTTVRYYFKRIENERLRSTNIEELRQERSERFRKKRKQRLPGNKAKECMQVYLDIYASYRQQNEAPPEGDKIIQLVAEKVGLSINMTRRNISAMRKIRAKSNEQDDQK